MRILLLLLISAVSFSACSAQKSQKKELSEEDKLPYFTNAQGTKIDKVNGMTTLMRNANDVFDIN